MATPARRGSIAKSLPTRPGGTAGLTTEPGATDVHPTPRETSNARLLQTALEVRYAKPSPPVRWSRRKTLAFIVIASTVLWGLIITAVVGGMRLIAG